MNWMWRTSVVLALALLLWPEFNRYRGEHLLADAAGRVERVLRGIDQGQAAVHGARTALATVRQAGALIPGDARATLTESIALMLLDQGEAAVQLLTAAIAVGERPELTLNLGRARFQVGDATGAQRAYLRSAWAAPAAISTLPAAMQAGLLDEVSRVEAELQSGRLSAPPSL